ncbi:uncharacterized protein LOC131208218 [Anopheles bellator]|uniref:uncharacterized protein LOC131208218 n=1 Tax=Anopheles bellator TaxID=139047 RepID=UPI0026470A1B|nr:uncharacterized protein LOC131208218 [Anopheles bellator]
MEDGLNLSYESGFHSDWKSIYNRDILFWTSHDYHTDPAMRTIVETISFLAEKLTLSPAVEFSAIDALELLLVRAFQSWKEPVTATKPGALEVSKGRFLKQLPTYIVAVLDITAKYMDASIKLDLATLRRLVHANGPSDSMLSVEFEVIKILGNEFRSSLLLGAVERFTKEYLIPLNVTKKETISRLGLKLLRLVTAERAAIYGSLRNSIKDEASFRRFKASKLILAGSITLTVLHLIPAVRHSKPILHQILEPIADDCGVQATNLIYLRDAIILQVIDRA